MNYVVLVTGGCGQVARALVERKSCLTYVSCSRSELDITDSDSIAAAFDRIGPHIVVNAAAYTAVDAAEDNFDKAVAVNTRGPYLLSKRCAVERVPLIHLSTDYVYDGSLNQPYTEEVAATPAGIYGRTKSEGEDAVRSNLSDHLIIRLSGVFSGHGKCFPRSILTAALKHSDLNVVSDQVSGPTSARSIASVLDVVASKAIDQNVSWGTYHFAQRPFISWYQFANVIIERAQLIDQRFKDVEIHPISTADFGARAPRPINACLDSSKLLSEFALEAQILCRDADLDDTIASIICNL